MHRYPRGAVGLDPRQDRQGCYNVLQSPRSVGLLQLRVNAMWIDPCNVGMELLVAPFVPDCYLGSHIVFHLSFGYKQGWWVNSSSLDAARERLDKIAPGESEGHHSR